MYAHVHVVTVTYSIDTIKVSDGEGQHLSVPFKHSMVVLH